MSGAGAADSREHYLIELSDLLGLVVDLAVSTLDCVSGASISVRLEGPQFETTHASAPAIRDIDEVQYGGGGGPCVQTLRTGDETLVAIPAPQWAAFSDHAGRAGVSSVCSLPLTVTDRTAAALNLYSTTRQTWDAPAIAAARKLARFAAVVSATSDALVSAQLANERLHQALESRDVIGQAKGILMVRETITADHAFDILRRASQRTNRKLKELAADLVQATQPGDRT